MNDDIFEQRQKARKSEQQSVVPDTAGSAVNDERFRLLAELVSAPKTLSENVLAFQKLDKLIHDDFLKLCYNIEIPHESTIYEKLLLLLSDLRELIEFPYLANKNIIAIGGGFSSGKSRFLNSVLGEKGLLPEGLKPTTAIPTFLSYGEEETIQSLNTFDRIQILDREELSNISHSFHKGTGMPDATISFYHILKLLQITSPNVLWRNIALLDTPGYSKPHAENDEDEVGSDAGNTDERKACEHLSQADHLIWVISAMDGTFQQPDIEFLRNKVKWTQPLYILINKADQRPKSDISKIFERIREDALNNGFQLAGISAYSSRDGNVIVGDDPATWFDAIDKKCKYTKWRGRFKEIFTSIIEFNAKEEAQCKTIENALKTAIIKGDDLMSADQIQQLQTLQKEINSDRKRHSAAVDQFAKFSDRVESQLNTILTQIGVRDEDASVVGLAGVCKIASSNLHKYKNGDQIVGYVDTFSMVRGCFIASKELENQIKIRPDEIKKNYANADDIFFKGAAVSITIYEVDFSEETIVCTIKPC